MTKIITKSAEETHRLGEQLAKTLKDGQIIALYGDLGSGKTTFVQGLAKGLGIKKRIISPTFIIVRSYEIKNKILNSKNTNKKLKMFYHVDLYRVNNDKEIEGLGLNEILNNKDSIVAIEWAKKIKSILPEKRVDIYFEYLSEAEREITIR